MLKYNHKPNYVKLSQNSNFKLMENNFFWLILNLLILHISSNDVCENKNPCECYLETGAIIDLSSIGFIDFPRFFEIAPPNCSLDDGRYSYNPCFSFDSTLKYSKTNEGNHPCKEAAACKSNPSSNGEFPEQHAIGLQNTAVFFNSSDHFGINYTVPGFKQNLTVFLECNPNVSDHELKMVMPETAENFNVQMTLTSKCACPNGCLKKEKESSHHLSTGSVLLIMFFTLLLIYLALGVIWNFCNGARGLELLPNLEFWNDLPKLIIEGVIFTCSCFGRRGAYGQV